MPYKHIQINSLLNKISKKDNLFSGDYTLDPYKNCEFGCLYCDSSFDSTIHIKSNAKEILEKEIKEVEKGTIIIGSVHDAYQNIEKQTSLTREILKIIEKNGFSCHILTKSDLVLRDVDVLSNIKDCKVTVSLISLDENISHLFEKNLPSPKTRMNVIKKLSGNGIGAGIALMPILPVITDQEIEEIVKEAKSNSASYFLSKHLELKGDQKDIFMKIIKENYPNYLKKYEELYENSYQPNEEYIDQLKNQISILCKEYNIKNYI